MSRTDRVLALLCFLSGTALAAACGAPPGPTPSSCTGDAQCSATARCTGHSCVENAAPVADFTWTGDLVASADLTLDASSSHDPDPGDVISSYAWRVSSTDAACSAPEITSTAQIVHVRFGCGGHWDVTLSVFDGKQQESAPVTKTLTVAERSGPAIVTAGPDQTVDHVCAGSPLTCTLAAQVQLSATLASSAPLTVRWSVQPPSGRDLDGTRRVHFDPDATSLTPAVTIETDGTAISGDWIFRVEALNGTDVLASDVTRVSVGNRPPTIRGTAPAAFPHTYLASSAFYVVNGSIPVTVTDPDGDPVTRQVAVHHSGDGTSVFQATDNDTSIGIAIMVPRSNPEWLIAPTGLSRSVSLAVTDVNGAAAAPASYTVTVGDNPPYQRQITPVVAAHTFDPVAMKYLSTPIIGYWADPDGDPLDHQVTTSDASASDCPTSELLSSNAVQLSCARTWTTTGDLQGFTAQRTADVTISDAWTSIVSRVQFRIGNRPPSATGAFSDSLRVTCGQGSGYCGSGGSGSPPHTTAYGPITTAYALTGLIDPDGDPLQIIPDATVTATGSSCSGTQACKLTFTLPKVEWCDSLSAPSTGIPFTVTDGAAPVSFSLAVKPTCG